MEVEYNKNIRIINTIYLLVLIIMSLYFGKVRSILFDGSYAVYKIYTFKTLIFAENRFPTVINCILPLIASKLNLSVKWILQAYIISYCILPIAVFIYLKCIAQNEKHVLVFLISISLFTFNIFFVPSHDALVGYYMVFILYSWLDSKPQISNKLYYIALFCLTNIIVFSHLSQTITIITLLGYFFIERKEKLYLSVVLSGILFSVLIKILFLTSSTEDNTLSGFGAMFDALKNISSVRMVCS